MQWLKRRRVLFGVVGALACAGDPTGNESTPTDITATPEVMFVTQGDSEAVIVAVVDEDGQILQADFTASNVGSGITVSLDPDFQQVTTGEPIRRQARFIVKGVDLVHSGFTVNALGLTKDIEVFSVPGELNAEITDSLPALGDTVTITAPTGTFFNENSLLTFKGSPPFVVSQDRTTITFIPGPDIDGPAVVSNVGVESNPDAVFELATPYRVKTDSILDIGTDVVPTAPGLGEVVTLTLPAGLRLIPESLASLNIAAAAVLPRNAALSTDSSTITFVPPPNADSFVVVSGVIPQRLAACCTATRILGLDTIPGYALQLPTAVKVTTPVVEDFPSTISDLTPAANDPVTVTSTDGDFTIDPAAQVSVGAFAAAVTGRTANSVTFIPRPGATGGVTVAGVSVVGFPLTLPSTGGNVTVSSTVTPLAGTDDPGTAPTLDVPNAGLSTILYDAGTYDFADVFGCCVARLYKLTVPSDRTITLTIDWPSNEDLGAYLFEAAGFNADGDTFTGFFADAAGEGAGGHPEVATDVIPAGTYILAVLNFSASDPQFFGIQMDAE